MTQLEPHQSYLCRCLTVNTPPVRLFFRLLSIAFAAGYALLALYQVFSHDYVVQDDARQHIFWMQRYVDPELFPGDDIADYFQGMAPLGYRWLYQLFAWVNIPPKLASNLLPLFLSVITAYFSDALSFAFFPVPLAAFLSSCLLSQSLWSSSELASATPRAFLYPLLLAFLFYLVKQKRVAVLFIVVLESCFYPQIALVSLGVLFLSLFRWQGGTPKLSRSPSDYGLFISSFLIIAGIVSLSKAGSDFGEILTRAEAMTMPEFQVKGRNEFFTEGMKYWLHGRSGLFHETGFVPPAICAGIALPLLLKMPVSQHIKSIIHPSIKILIPLLIASLGLYILAHLVLFELHLPNRYSSHSLRLAIALTSGISWVLIFDLITQGFSGLDRALFKQVHSKKGRPHWSMKAGERLLLSTAINYLLLMGIILYPFLFLKTFPKVGYKNLEQGKLVYEYFAKQPKDSLIASLSAVSSNIPYFSERSVLVSAEHAIAYHKGYYTQFRQRAIDLITAQYTTDPVVLQTFIDQYGIDFWLLDNAAFDPAYLLEDSWIRQYQPAAQTAVQQLQQGKIPLLQTTREACTVFATPEAVILDAHCILRIIQK